MPMFVMGTPEELARALAIKEQIEQKRREIGSLYWLYTGRLAHSLGLTQFYQCKN